MDFPFPSNQEHAKRLELAEMLAHENARQKLSVDEAALQQRTISAVPSGESHSQISGANKRQNATDASEQVEKRPRLSLWQDEFDVEDLSDDQLQQADLEISDQYFGEALERSVDDVDDTEISSLDQWVRDDLPDQELQQHFDSFNDELILDEHENVDSRDEDEVTAGTGEPIIIEDSSYGLEQFVNEFILSPEPNHIDQQVKRESVTQDSDYLSEIELSSYDHPIEQADIRKDHSE